MPTSNLSLRLKTAAFFIPVVSCSAIYVPWLFQAFLGLTVFQGLWEFQFAIQQGVNDFTFPFWILPTSGTCVMFVAAYTGSFITVQITLNMMIICLLLAHLGHILKHRVKVTTSNMFIFMSSIFAMFYITLPMSLGVLITFMPHGYAWTVLCLGASWVGDACAYFAGKAWGTIHLTPHISPGKTLEGNIANLIATTGFVMAAHLLQPIIGYWSNASLFSHMVMGVVISILGIAGDLIGSMVKRLGNLKDSGQFFPGHGGVIDRFDSFYLIIPCIYYFLQS